MKATISIPFPAWEGIFTISGVVARLRRNEFLGQVLPKNLNNPRRITLRGAPLPEELKDQWDFDDCLVIDYWWPGGTYVRLRLGGLTHSDGTTWWRPIGIRLRWVDERFSRRKMRVSLEITDGREIAPLIGYGRGDEALPEVAAAIERRVKEWEAAG